MPRKTRNKIVKVKILTKQKAKYNCKLCYKSFNSVKSKEKHLFCTAHTKQITKSNIRCEKCNKTFFYKQTYLQHLKTEHSNLKSSVACNDCNVRCPDKETLEKHIMKAHESKKHPCPHCGMLFARSGHVVRHIQQKGCGGFSVEKHSCEICGAWFSRKDNLMVHLRSMHIKSSRYACKHCPATVKTFSRLITHVQSEHSEKPYFECDTCGKSTSSKAALVKHMEIHGEKKHNCDVCGYTTFTAEVMRRHVLTHVTDKPYKCDQCSCSFIQVSQLRSHIMNKHTSQFNCATCGETFKKIDDYAVHIQTHSRKKGLRCHFEGCPFSEKVFKTTHRLAVHLKRHFTENTEEVHAHKCSVCGKWFSSVVLARRHLSTHALDRPRRCMYCVQARAYVRGQQLLRHVRKCHRDVFMAHLLHVRKVLGATSKSERLRKSEGEAVLNVMDAEAERILHGYGAGVLYGGMQDDAEAAAPTDQHDRPEHIDIEVPPIESGPSSESDEIAEEVEIEEQAEVDEAAEVEEEDEDRMSDEELARSLERLLRHLVDRDMLQQLGADRLPLPQLLEKLISECGVAVPAGGGGGRLRLLARLLLQHVLDLPAAADLADRAARAPAAVDRTVRRLLRTLAPPAPPSPPAPDH